MTQFKSNYSIFYLGNRNLCRLIALLIFFPILSCQVTFSQTVLHITDADLSIEINKKADNHLYFNLHLKEGVPKGPFTIHQEFAFNPGYKTIRVRGTFEYGRLDDSLIVYNNRAQIVEMGIFNYDGIGKADSVSGYGKLGLIGVRNGHFTYYKAGKNYTSIRKEIEIDYQNGYLEGKYITYFPDGTIYKSESFSHDEWNGDWRENYSTGDPKEMGSNQNGQRENTWLFYYPNGQLSDSMNYKEGLLNGKSLSYYENGNKKSVRYFIEDVSEGTQIEYYRNGAVKSKFVSSNGVIIETKQFFDSTGKEIQDPDRGPFINGAYYSPTVPKKFNDTLQFNYQNTALNLPLFPKRKYRRLLEKSMGTNLSFTITDSTVSELVILKSTRSEKSQRKLIAYLQTNLKVGGIYYNHAYHNGKIQFTIKKRYIRTVRPGSNGF